MAVEQAYPGAAPAAIGRGLVASSFQYYLSGVESLRVTVQAILPGGRVDVLWRTWRESDRQIVLTRESIDYGSVVALSTTHEYPLQAGALLNVRVGVGSGTAFYGLLWVRVQLLQGQGAAALVVGTLVQGYISSQNDLGWPGSPIEKQDQTSGCIVSVAGVLGATSVTWTVPTGERWRVICGRFTYVAGGAAGNRNPFVGAISATGDFVYVGISPIVVVAGNTFTHAFAAGHSPTPDSGPQQAHLSFPNDLELGAGWAVTASVTGAQVGDGITAAVIAIRKRVDG